MRLVQTLAAAVALAGTALFSAGLGASGSTAPTPPTPVETRPGPPTLSILTYNIEGLPVPVAFGRAAAADRIADRLKALRSAGEQPHVVVLQEAFGAAQREIGQKAGYRYVAFGPDRDMANTEPMDGADRAFAAQARILKGEGIGKWVSSGLAILSDYPILSVRRAAFPAFACAGYDCLANKGVMMATIRVPGSQAPVDVIATHLNSKAASGVSKDRFDAAFERQVRTIDTFLRANLSPAVPYVFAGDTNIGGSRIRRAQFEAMLARLPRRADTGTVRTALATCLDGASKCALAPGDDVRRAFRHGKDWQVYAAGAFTALRPLAIAIPFGHDAAGNMLSDHIGYTALYRLVRDVAPARTPHFALENGGVRSPA